MKIKFGAIITDGRGKIGGHVASKNRSGAYMRTKVTPTNPNTTAQSQARSLLASLSQGWRTLTTAQRLAWNGAVSDWSKTDIFGDIKNPTGLNLFIKLNANLLGVGLVAINTPPAKLEVPTAVVDSGTYNATTGLMVITFLDESADAVRALVRATPKLSQGVSFVKSELRVIGSVPVVSDTVILTGNYSAKYGSVPAGSNVYASVQFILSNGQKTVEQKVKLVVVV